MKKLQLSLFAAALLFAASCGNSSADIVTAGTEVEISPTTGKTLSVDNSASSIQWTGSKAIGGSHTGTISLKESTLNVENNILTGGKFVFDFESLTPTDQDEEGNGKLRGHLLSPDFLDAAQFPEGYFEIASVTEGVDTENVIYKDGTHTVIGNLTLKNVTKSITFPAKIHVSDDGVHAQAEFDFDRTEWNINYNSDASIKDKFINKEIRLSLNVIAK